MKKMNHYKLSLMHYLLVIGLMFIMLISCNDINNNEKISQDINAADESVSMNENEQDNVIDIEVTEEIETVEGDPYDKYDDDTKELIREAENGDIDSMNTLAFYYFNGYNVEQDYQKSLDWSLKSAEGGNLASMFNVGYIYSYGYTGNVNDELAFEWYNKAADQMFPKALNALGHMYYNGLGIEKDVSKALEYTLQSAGFLHNYSMSNMGTIFEQEGLDGDVNFWSRMAAKNYVIQAGSNNKLYDHLVNGKTSIDIEYQYEGAKIPKELITDITYKFYSGTLYEYLESESVQYKDFELSELIVNEEKANVIHDLWYYDNLYLIDLDNDDKRELVAYHLEGSIGNSTFHVLVDENEEFSSENLMIIDFEYGINGFTTFGDKKYFVVASIDIGNRVIYKVNIYTLDGLNLGESVSVELKELDTLAVKTFQLNETFDDLNNIVEKRIVDMFYDKYGTRMLYEHVNEDMVIDCDINNDGVMEHYDYVSMFWGTINRPIRLEFNDNSEDDLSILEKVLSFNDIGIPLGIEIFTHEGINYVGLLSYELGTNNHCLTTFKLQDDETTVILNHLITFTERFDVR